MELNITRWQINMEKKKNDFIKTTVVEQIEELYKKIILRKKAS